MADLRLSDADSKKDDNMSKHIVIVSIVHDWFKCLYLFFSFFHGFTSALLTHIWNKAFIYSFIHTVVTVPYTMDSSFSCTPCNEAHLKTPPPHPPPAPPPSWSWQAWLSSGSTSPPPGLFLFPAPFEVLI